MSCTALRPAVGRLTTSTARPRSSTFASSATSSSSSSSSASTSTSPERAVEYLSSLLRLPSNRQFPAPLALRILTHRSYRGSHVLGLGSRSRGAAGAASNSNDLEGAAPHNARLAFLGKRAAKGYLAMLMHSRAAGSASTSSTVAGGGDIEERLENLVHLNNLGREVGSAWKLQDVMRWQSNVHTGLGPENDGSIRVAGETVQAILGGTLMHFGSPAAQRLFHAEMLPLLARQLKDIELEGAVEEIRRAAMEELGPGGRLVAAAAA